MQPTTPTDLVVTGIFGVIMLILLGAVVSAFVLILVNLAERLGTVISQLLFGRTK